MLGRLFRRPRDLRQHGWRRGDLAVCVRADWVDTDLRNPAIGDVLRVAGIQEAIERGIRGTFLAFDGWPANHFFLSLAFRKVVEDDEPAEIEFTALIRRGKRTPVRTPEPVV